MHKRKRFVDGHDVLARFNANLCNLFMGPKQIDTGRIQEIAQC